MCLTLILSFKKYIMKKKHQINFRTLIKPDKYPFIIDYNTPMMFAGSCFTESIGLELQKFKFNIDINPFGILYNPISIKKGLLFLCYSQQFAFDNLFYNNERWNSYYHHSRFSSPDKKNTLNNINKRILSSSEHLKKTKFLFITFGTAIVYENIKTSEIVSNCHKLPAKNFNKRMLTADEIIIEYIKLINCLEEITKDIKIIFTISPVRHISDGLTNNMYSKSILMTAIMQITEHFENAFYFPAYEIMIDDLRDYRFYTQDMLHPNKTAIDYIFDFFIKSFIGTKTYEIMDKIEQIIRAKNHRPFNKKAESFQIFLKKNISKINNLSIKYPNISFIDEKKYFEKLILY